MKEEITIEELKEAATPLIDLLRKKGNPHMTVCVRDDRVDITEDLIGYPFEYND